MRTHADTHIYTREIPWFIQKILVVSIGEVGREELTVLVGRLTG